MQPVSRKYLFATPLLAAALVAGCREPQPAGAAAASLVVSELTASAPPARRDALERALDEVRRATERFRDVEVAKAEGYIPDPMNMCVTAPMEGLPRQLGAMGIHYFRPDLLGITGTEPRIDGTGTHTDFTRPAVLLYEPQPDGSLELVAVENLVFQDAWKAAGHTAAPAFHGFDYYPMVDNPRTPGVDEAHMFEPHYELHMWLYRSNPTGMFMEFNPAVTCEHHRSAAGS